MNEFGRFRVLGTTDEITVCDHCGRNELRGTVVLGVLDDDGNVEDRVFFGATCGARAVGQSARVIRTAARAADRAAAESLREMRADETARDLARASLLRFTEDCPLAPTMCRKGSSNCPAHS